METDTKQTALDREVLPAAIRPLHYNVTISPNPAAFLKDSPDVSDFTFTGQVSIVVKVHEDTDCILINASELDAKAVSVQVNNQYSSSS